MGAGPTPVHEHTASNPCCRWCTAFAWPRQRHSLLRSKCAAHSTRRLTLPSSGLAPAAQAWPSFHSGPIPRRLREPLMSNVRRRKEPLERVWAKVAAAWHPTQCARHARPRQFGAGVRHLEERVSPARLANNNLCARAEARARTNVSQSVGPQPLRARKSASARKNLVALPRGLRLELGMRSSSPPPTPNPSFERTHHGSPLQALISFWALRGLPRCASQLKR